MVREPGSGRSSATIALEALIVVAPWIAALAVWLSPLAFVPVPWPDDSAFYFVARELFKWPPRWVMLAQAPFEPTYRLWNFNTMPLFPALIGIGRALGIDGSFALKVWPLSAWAASGSLLGRALLRARLPRALALLATLMIALDPILRWASVLIRPESVIGLAGVALVLGLTFGYPVRLRERGGIWDPTAALLALAAYTHFNAIHLVFIVAIAFCDRPRRLLAIAGRCALYLAPWLATVAAHPALFAHQMATQWRRLAVGNGWLDSPAGALAALFQDMGSPEPWPAPLRFVAGPALWLFIVVALACVLLRLVSALRGRTSATLRQLVPAAGWIAGAAWLWHTKPEVWFVYYLHLSLLVFAAIVAVVLHEASLGGRESVRIVGYFGLAGWTAIAGALVAIFAWTDGTQAAQLSRSESWRWDAYRRFADCVDRRLTAAEQARPGPPGRAPFRAWFPTFPDLTIELSRRHPDWELTRTNDFWDRNDRALRHGVEADAVVVTETINRREAVIDAPQAEHPEIASLWMTWRAHYLYRLLEIPGWKPVRHLCQEGRWQAFIYTDY